MIFFGITLFSEHPGYSQFSCAQRKPLAQVQAEEATIIANGSGYGNPISLAGYRGHAATAAEGPQQLPDAVAITDAPLPAPASILSHPPQITNRNVSPAALVSTTRATRACC